MARHENERLERALAQLSAVQNRSRGSMAEDLAILASVLQPPPPSVGNESYFGVASLGGMRLALGLRMAMRSWIPRRGC